MILLSKVNDHRKGEKAKSRKYGKIDTKKQTNEPQRLAPFVTYERFYGRNLCRVGHQTRVLSAILTTRLTATTSAICVHCNSTMLFTYCDITLASLVLINAYTWVGILSSGILMLFEPLQSKDQKFVTQKPFQWTNSRLKT